MKRKIYLPTMVQAITVLTVLKMLTNAQTTCNHGLGRVVYERIPDHQLQGFDDDVMRDTVPPFRMLEKCQDLCLRDRTAVNNLVRTCTSFNFQPGVRIASFSGTPEYEESICYLTREQAHPEGIGNLVLVPNSVHFTEVCLTSNRIERECPNRRYVFERHPRKKLKLLASDHKEVQAANRTDCEERCMNEFTFVCRSISYNSLERTCSMSRFTRRSHPELLYDDPNADYLENTCLSPEKRCDGLAVFVKEENKRLGGPFEVDMYVNISLEECQNLCLRAEKYFCRSIEYDERRRECIVSDEDSVSQKDDLRTSSSPHRHLFDLVCLDNRKYARGEFSDNSLTSHLFSDGRRPDTAFQRYRNSRLGGEFHSEITSRTLSECLDECLRQASFQCRSAVYSERFRVCRLSRFNQRDGHRIIYDADYDYYENLMSAEGEGFGPNYRPDPLGQDTNYHTHNRPPYMGGGSSSSSSGYPNYPSNYPGMSHYPGGSNYYPGQGNMYPGRYGGGGMYPGDRYGGQPGYGGSGGYGPAGPVQPGYQPNYPMGGGYPPPGGSGYPPHGGSGYPPQGGGGGYPGTGYPDLGTGYPGGPGGYPNKFTSRCDEGDNFRQVGVRLRMRRPFVKRFTSAPSLPMCERECGESRDFICRSFNFKAHSPSPYSPAGPERDNCELSDKDSRELDVSNPAYFEMSNEYDYFERSPGRQGQGDCLDVSQQCSEDGMEFALRTPEGFFGRIYTYGFYDRCFFRGNGGTINVLRISGSQGYPECGTQRYGDTMTNIVVVQFSDFVQTGRDKRYNLTCLFRGPGEAVVTSGYIGAGSGSPIPIEYLPAENSLSSKVRLMILYQNRPTTTIAVGDPLTFRLEAQDNYNYPTDIFATNVIARDPYSGRSVQLIDRYGCPVDNYVFPGLDKSREGDGLEARFNAFKIPESNFLVFEATVRTCRDGCQPAYCTGQAGRSEPSFGRRKRDVNDTELATEETSTISTTESTTTTSTTAAPSTTKATVTSTTERKASSIRVRKDPEVVKVRQFASTTIRIPIDKVVRAKIPSTEAPKIMRPVEIQIEEDEAKEPEEEEYVRKMIEVFDSRLDIDEEGATSESVTSTQTQTVCIASSEYYGLVSAVIVMLCSLLGFAAGAGMMYKRYYTIGLKNRDANSTNTSSTSGTPRHAGLGLDRRPFSFLMAASQNFKNRKSDDSPQELITDHFGGSLSDIPLPPSTARKGIYDTNKTSSSSRRGWSESNFSLSKKLKEGTFGKNAGSISRKMFESIFPKEQSRDVVDVVKENPLNCDENFIMSNKFQDPSEPIYTDPSLFEMERSRSSRSMVFSNQGHRPKASDEV